MAISVPKQFYERENRDGFVIGEVMKRCWAAGMQSLVDVKEFCEKHSVRFFAVYGTLLGTVRHGGFIPWDDDIDIGMVRDDYIRFLDGFSEISGNEYQVFNPYSRSWYCMNFSHVVNGKDLSFDREHLNKWHGCPFLVGPDIYPYYYIPRNKDEEEYIMHTLEKVDAAIAMSRQSEQLSKANGRFSPDNRLNEALAYSLVELQHETGYEFTTDRPINNQLEILYDQVCRLTSSEEADYLTRYDEYAKDRSKKFPKEWLENTIELPFEYISMPVPVVYDAVLKARFGSGYMMPAREPALHGYPFYSKQMEDTGNILEGKERLLRGKGQRYGDVRSDNRKKVVFYTSVRDMLVYSDCAIDKIKQVLTFFEAHKERIMLWWVPGQFVSEEDFSTDLTAPQFMKEYELLEEEFLNSGCGVLDLSDDIDSAVFKCDLFFGDIGLIWERIESEGKQALIQDYRVDDVDKISVAIGLAAD